ADDRVAYSFDGNYVIHVPEGEYDVEYSYPGYESKIIHILMGGSFAISQDILLNQASPTPSFPTASLTISIEANSSSNSYIFSAKLLSSNLIEDNAVFLWSSDSGKFNSTIGKTVLWTPLEDKEEYEVKVIAFINGEAFSSTRVKLKAVKTSEFPEALLFLTFTLTLTIVKAVFKRRQRLKHV
ncbi:MAG: hypothetical protein QXZ53_07235, partial [Candidatus Bathyarchaeia archaeon]